ncbi:MAG: GtrA family protein [Clostridium sp.]
MKIREKNKTSKEIEQITNYIIFAGITTVFNIFIYEILKIITIFRENLVLNNFITTILTVIFAFITNKLFVFKDKENTIEQTTKQFTLFIIFRIIIYILIELLLFTFMIKQLNLSDNFVKIFTQILVVYIIYLFSKKYVFSK